MSARRARIIRLVKIAGPLQGCHEARRDSMENTVLAQSSMNETAPFGTYAPTGIVRWAIERTRAMPDSWAGRRLVFVLRRIAVATLRGAPVDIETLGARMRLHPYNNISEKKV